MTVTGVSHQHHRRHEAGVLALLAERGPMSRAELAQRLGLKRTTLSEATSELLRTGAVRQLADERPASPGRGRPVQLLCLDPDAGQFLGFDIGHERVHLVAVNASHQVIASGSRRYDRDSDPSHRMDAAFDLVDELVASDGLTVATLLGVGIGVPGPYADAEVEDADSPLARVVAPWGGGAAWKRAIHQRVRDRFETAVLVDNNVRLAALAEACWDRPAMEQNSIFLRLSDGVGGGIVVAGSPLLGANGFGGEMGHVSADPSGQPCRCGKRGCLETMASAHGVLRRADELGLNAGSLAHLGSLARVHDERVAQLTAEVGAAVGRVLGIVSVALNPAEIVVGGDVADALPGLLDHIERAVRDESLPVNETQPVVRATRLGDRAGALGAVALLVRREARSTSRQGSSR